MMKAELLKLDELVEFSEGELSFHGRRLVLHDIHAFAQTRKDLAQMLGVEYARRVLTRFGYFWGEADAAAMKRVFRWDDVREWLKAGARLHTLQGVAKTVVKSLDVDEAAQRLNMTIVWHNSGEAEEHLAEFGKSDHPVCWMLNGYASGYASYCLSTPVYFIEQKCRAKGDRICLGIGKDRNSWGTELDKHLPYFRTEDIGDKIRTLSRDLRQKTREASRQRRRLQLLEARAPTSLVEVHSESFRRVVELATRVAPFDSSILLTGESGAGKEVLARYIHKLSHRSEGTFVAVNCAALPDTLLESELFGHKAGAFTGAIRDHDGLFAEAQRGIIFLDEIGDVSDAMQVKLLRVLQTKEILRVGDSKSRRVDVRVMAATNRNLTQAVQEGTFREDLFYRLRVIEIEVPPLRERNEDILPLVRHFVQRFSRKLNLPRLRLDATCVDYLQAYRWPGNVRELENAIERAAVFSRDGLILPEHLPPAILHSRLTGAQNGDALTRTLAQVEFDHIRAVLELMGGNKTRAAKLLGISQATLWRKLKRVDNQAASDRP